MRLFIYELITAGGLGTDVPTSLRTEGAAMLNAIVADFERVAGIETVTMPPTPLSEHEAAFREIARTAEAALIIAPEFDDLLASRSEWAQESGCRLLGSTPEAIRLTGDKLVLANWLGERGVPTPQSWLAESSPKGGGPWVLKPRHGAGSQATFLVTDREQLATALLQAEREMAGQQFIMQPYVPGQPASVSLLVGPRGSIATPGATQRLSDDGRFRYLGGVVPLPSPLRTRAQILARRAIASVPGIFGYVGVDLVLSEDAEEREDAVIEINPRLTTSYLGLRQLTVANLAECWLRLRRGEPVEQPLWKEDLIEFDGDGSSRRWRHTR